MAADHSSTRGYGLLEGYLAGRRFHLAETLLRPLSAQTRLLDIGCGVHPAFLLRQDCALRYGVDREITHEQQQHFAGQVHLQRWDLATQSTLPFEDAFFDVVTMLAVIEHLEAGRLPPLLAEVSRVLQPGGRVVLTTPAPWSHALLRGMARVHLVSPVEIAEHKSVHSHDSLRALLTEAGFDALGMRFGSLECWANLWAMATRLP